ncbi:MAG: AEC family transporter [Alphaproteobacteria bacterium]|nr:MAG: AEC family transporter [Alphaproteobacteria bacterium]
MADILTIIAPVFLLMILGFGFGKTRLFPEGASSVLISFVWYVAIPALLFRSLAPRHLPEADELLFVGGYYSAMYSVYVLAFLIARYAFGLTVAERGIFALSCCFINGGFVGIPILQGAYGDEGVRLLLMLLSFHSLTLLPITTIIVERGKAGGGGSKGGILLKTFQSIRQNPIIIALVVGLTWSALQLPFPRWLDRLAELPAQAASPVGLFAAGLALANVRIAGDLVQAGTAVFLKLLLMPVAVFAMTRFVFGLPDLWVGAATLVAALPTGMIPYSFATLHGVGARRAASTIMISTGLSAFTITTILLITAL